MNSNIKIGIGAAIVIIGITTVALVYKSKKNVATATNTANASVTDATDVLLSQDPAVQRVINQIKADTKWLADVTTKAKSNGTTLENQLIADAKWVLANG